MTDGLKANLYNFILMIQYDLNVTRGNEHTHYSIGPESNTVKDELPLEIDVGHENIILYSLFNTT
jgi:hypothetical protein